MSSVCVVKLKHLLYILLYSSHVSVCVWSNSSLFERRRGGRGEEKRPANRWLTGDRQRVKSNDWRIA